MEVNSSSEATGSLSSSDISGIASASEEQTQNVKTEEAKFSSFEESRDKNKSNSPVTQTGSSDTVAKSHKVEGKNKKSLHHKQQQQQQQLQQNNNTNQRKNQSHSPKQTQSHQQQTQQQNSTTSTSNGRRGHQKILNGSSKLANNQSNIENPKETNTTCLTLDDFSKRAQELKAEINQAMEKQAAHKNTDQPVEVVKLKDDILKLSGLEATTTTSNDDNNLGVKQNESNHNQNQESSLQTSVLQSQKLAAPQTTDSSVDYLDSNTGNKAEAPTAQLDTNLPSKISTQQVVNDSLASQEKLTDSTSTTSQKESSDVKISKKPSACSNLSPSLERLTLDESKDKSSADLTRRSTSKKQTTSPQSGTIDDTSNIKTQDCKESDGMISDEFESLNAKLDVDSKFVALYSSLHKHFDQAPHLLEPICRKFVNMSEQNNQLALNCEKYQAENQKLNMVKQKLENLCRELQKSNNAIRIESLDLIKVEQGKAKDQTTKIQSTLSGVIKLFDENQQRNMSLRQENQELQTKLKSLLDHCDNWEKSVEAALRQRDIENRLIKTELAKANLMKNEEKEKFLGEKQELLQILSMMQEQQHRIEGQEAKLRSDLSSYASKYDECQEVISKGMNRFQTESKRMLKQIEKSKQDYKVLLSKYESSNKRMAQLLEEKQCWDRAMNLANKKIETLERLCRALSDRKVTSTKTSTESEIVKKSSNTNNKNKPNV